MFTFQGGSEYGTSMRVITGPKQIGDLFDVSWFVYGCFGASMGLCYSKMANLGFQTYSNTFWNMFGTSTHSKKYGPLDPVLITKIFQNTQEQLQTQFAQ